MKSPLKSLFLVGLLTLGSLPAIAAGPNDGSGGQTTASDEYSVRWITGNDEDKSIVARHTTEFRTNMVRVLRRMSHFQFGMDDSDQAIVSRLVHDHRLHEIIYNAKINVQSEACASDNPHHRAGAAFVEQKTICLSAQELAKVPKISLEAETLALGLHEMSHLIGTSEKEAQTLQNWILAHPRYVTLSDYGYDYFQKPYDSAGKSLLSTLFAEFSALEEIYPKIETIDQLKICSSIAVFTQQEATAKKLVDTFLIQTDFQKNYIDYSGLAKKWSERFCQKIRTLSTAERKTFKLEMAPVMAELFRLEKVLIDYEDLGKETDTLNFLYHMQWRVKTSKILTPDPSLQNRKTLGKQVSGDIFHAELVKKFGMRSSYQSILGEASDGTLCYAEVRLTPYIAEYHGFDSDMWNFNVRAPDQSVYGEVGTFSSVNHFLAKYAIDQVDAKTTRFLKVGDPADGDHEHRTKHWLVESLVVRQIDSNTFEIMQQHWSKDLKDYEESLTCRFKYTRGQN